MQARNSCESKSGNWPFKAQTTNLECGARRGSKHCIGWSGCHGVPLPMLVRLVEAGERTPWSLTNVTPRSAFDHAPHPGHAKVETAVCFPLNAPQGGFDALP